VPVPLRLAPCDLPALDAAAVDAVVLFVGEEERPLFGLAGLVDWRLAGGLTRLLRDQLLVGSLGESLLTLAPGLPTPRVFVFGLGPSRDAAVRFPDAAARALATLQKAGMKRVLVGLPELPPAPIAAPVLNQTFGPAPLDVVLAGDLAILARLLPAAARAP